MPAGIRGIVTGVLGLGRNLRYGFLLWPGAIAGAFAALALGLVEIDRSAGSEGVDFGFSAGVDGARSLLSTIATSLITVAGVTFSIMIVTLQLVSQQFSPRALRTFLGDRLNQAVAGYFIGVFVYCLLVLRTVEGGDGSDPEFLPALSISVAIALALGALGLLLVFIDHMATRIQVSTIASSVTQETLSSVGELYPEPFGDPESEDPEEILRRWREAGEPRRIRPERPGYVQAAEIERLPKVEGVEELRVYVAVAPGDFVTERDTLAEVWQAGGEGQVEAVIRAATVIGSERDLAQDVGYGVRQLADIAIRSLSPSVNDPTTAGTCLGYLQAIMERLAGRAFPAEVRRLNDGSATVIARRPGWDEYVDAAFVQVARYASDPRTAGVLLEALIAVAEAAAETGAHDRIGPLVAVAQAVSASVDPAGERDEERIRELIERLERHSRSGG